MLVSGIQLLEKGIKIVAVESLFECYIESRTGFLYFNESIIGKIRVLQNRIELGKHKFPEAHRAVVIG